MGDSAGRGRFQAEVHRMRTPDYDCQKTRGKKYKRFKEKSLKQASTYGNIDTRDILFYPCSRFARGPETIRRCKRHEQV